MTARKTDNWNEVRTESEAALPPEVVHAIEKARRDSRPESHLISVLHMVQERMGHLGKAQLDAVAQLLRVPASKVTGVATFYHYYRLNPKGRYLINVCLGTACYVRGAASIAQKLKDELGIDFGETTSDGMFSLEASRCLGTCGLAPVIMVNGEVHGKVQPDAIPALLERCVRAARSEAGAEPRTSRR
jgi:NADH:ubiquinone oxidoreductase subunit E